jgi:hypothetical protein
VIVCAMISLVRRITWYRATRANRRSLMYSSIAPCSAQAPRIKRCTKGRLRQFLNRRRHRVREDATGSVQGALAGVMAAESAAVVSVKSRARVIQLAVACVCAD